MTTNISKETRWFLDEKQIQPLSEWFEHLEIPQELSPDGIYPRQDYYLALPGLKNLGIKLREPKQEQQTGKLQAILEVKHQISPGEEMSFPNNNKGIAERWQKVSYSLAEGAEQLLQINPTFPLTDKDWICVYKDRLLAKYDAASDIVCDSEDYPAEGCGIELARVRVFEQVYYTFGLEAFSTSGRSLDDNFSSCCQHLFKSMFVKNLSIDNSISYPGFLQAILK